MSKERKKQKTTVASRKPELEQLLAEGKQEEARTLLREMLSAPLSDEERGAILVGFAAAYLALANQINETYKTGLEEEVEGLEEIDRLSRSIDEKLGLARVRTSLHGTDADEEH